MRYLLPAVLFLCLRLSLSAQPACVETACCCGAPEEVGVPNGNFEDPPNPPADGRITFYGGETYSTWSVLAGSIDLLGPDYSNFKDGDPNGASNFIDLNGFTPGTIATTLTGLMPGSRYVIVLWYAKNSGGPNASCNILVAGGSWLNQTWTATNNGGDVWLERCFSFTAQGATAELRFVGSGPTANAGVLLDNITMWKCPMDNQPPVAGNPPASPLLVECSDPVPPADDPQFTDNCSDDISVQLTEQTINQPCFYNIQRTWIADDGCGNTKTVTQLVQVRDTEAPQFLTPPSDFVLPCGEDHVPAFFNWLASNGGGEAQDNCDANVAWSNAYQQAPNGRCRATPVTFTVRDDCGNVNTAVANFIIEDTEPPFLLQEAQNDTVLCSANAQDSLIRWLLTRGGALASDPCGPVIWTSNYAGPPNAPALQVTFTATDGCLNSVSTTATFFQPVLLDTTFQTLTTCDPQQAGVDTTLLVQGNCQFFTITTTSLIPADTTYLTAASCDPALVGYDTLTLTNVAGCDSLVITTTTLIPSDTIYLTAASCDPALVGSDTLTLTNVAGCDSLVITNTSLIPSDTVYLTATTCDSALVGSDTLLLTNVAGCDSLVITTTSLIPSDTVYLTAATCDPALVGSDTLMLTNVAGCDSLVITTTTLIPSDTVYLTATTCDPTLVGNDTLLLSNVAGCDSLVITNTSLIPSDTVYLTATTCDPALAGNDTLLLSNVAGCDSLVITTTTLVPSDTVYLTATTCDPALVGNDTLMLSNVAGCDSLVITTTNLLPSDTVYQTAFTCDPATAGVFLQNLSNQYGCDSLVVQTVILAPNDTTLLFDASCNPASVGVFTQLFQNVYGCDSTVILTVSFAQSDTILLNTASCDTAAAGVFTQNLTTPEGCDSVVITTVSLLPTDAVYQTAVTCDPAQAGVFVTPLTNQFGCDSIVTRTVILLPADTTFLSATTCNAGSAGVFIQNLVNLNGCDSMVVTTVSLLPSDTVYQTAVTCDPAQAGVFVTPLTNQFGCDSIVTRTVMLLSADTTLLSTTTCNAGSAGIFIQNLVNLNGCDSSVITSVSFVPLDTVYQNTTTCDPAAAGVFAENFLTTGGCDSVVVTTLSLLPSDTVYQTVFTCDPAQTGLSIQTLLNQYGCDSVVYTQTTLSQLPQVTLEASAFSGFGVSCAGATDGSITAAAGGVGPFVFNWSNNGAGPFIDGLGAGNYTVTVVDANGCTVSASAVLTAPQPLQLNLTVNQPDCFGQALGALSAVAGGGAPPYRYALAGASFQSNPHFVNLAPADYTLSLADANDCLLSQPATIEPAEILMVNLGDDITVEQGEPVMLQATVSIPLDSVASALWSVIDSTCDNCLELTLHPLVSGAYSVRVTANNGCSGSDTVRVIVLRNRNIYVPNAFSPNGDGVNDILMIFSRPGAVNRVKSFLVFDRWGEAVLRIENFQPNDASFGWDGNYRGQALNPGVYVWVAEIEFADGETEVLSGDVGLVR